MEVNGIGDFRGSLSLRAEETELGFRFFLEDDEESFFELNLENVFDDEFEFQIAAPRFQRTAEELFRNSRILPLQSSENPNSQFKENTTKFLVRVPSQRILPLEKRSRDKKGRIIGWIFGCLQLRKKKSDQIRATMDFDDSALMNTILNAVDFAVRSGRWGRADHWTEVAVERNGAINAAIDHCKMSYSGGAASPRRDDL